MKISTSNFVASLLATLGLMSATTTVVAAGLKGEDAAHAAQQVTAWHEIAKLPNIWEGTWQGVSGLYDFPENTPLTPAAATYLANFTPKPLTDTQFANCQNPGMPFVMNIVAMPMKFTPTPGIILLYIEGFGTTRILHTDGRKHTAKPNPTYYGESIAHWEGDTLVVDSTGFVKDTLLQIGLLHPKSPPAVAPSGDGGDSPPQPFGIPVFMQHGPTLRFVERLRLTDFNTLQIETTTYDDTIFATPLKTTRIYHRYTGRNSDPQEWLCSDNRDYYDVNTGVLQHDVKDKAISVGK